MQVIETSNVPIKAWTDKVLFEEEAKRQLINLASLPFIHKHIAVMPDVHAGAGTTIGTVFATQKAIIPAAVGVDIGCGMMACKTTLKAGDLPDSLASMRSFIESMIPHGSVPGKTHIGSWVKIPKIVSLAWNHLKHEFNSLCRMQPRLAKSNNITQLGTLGGGNHFVEICLDEDDCVWFMLHSGSRGIGNLIGRTYIELAKKDMKRYFINLPDKDLAYFPQDSQNYVDYIRAVHWAQIFASENRYVMMCNLIVAVKAVLLKEFDTQGAVINCHHNYVSYEYHFGDYMNVTRKGAVSAQKGEMGIIPGSMGTKSFIVRGLGNRESFCSCSHGAGRVMSRTKAKQTISLLEHESSLSGVECRKDASTIDESPCSYKNIDDVMESQKDLVEIVHTLKQVLCIKG